MRHNENFYDSADWDFVRKSVMRDNRHLCKECARYGKAVKAHSVHHIYPLEVYPEYRLQKWNLIPLCKSCHNKMHIRGSHELTPDGKRWQRAVLMDKQQYDNYWG